MVKTGVPVEAENVVLLGAGSIVSEPDASGALPGANAETIPVRSAP